MPLKFFDNMDIDWSRRHEVASIQYSVYSIQYSVFSIQYSVFSIFGSFTDNCLLITVHFLDAFVVINS